MAMSAAQAEGVQPHTMDAGAGAGTWVARLASEGSSAAPRLVLVVEVAGGRIIVGAESVAALSMLAWAMGTAGAPLVTCMPRMPATMASTAIISPPQRSMDPAAGDSRGVAMSGPFCTWG